MKGRSTTTTKRARAEIDASSNAQAEMKAMGKALEDIYTVLYAIRELLGAKESEVDLPTDSDMTPVGIMICFFGERNFTERFGFCE